MREWMVSNKLAIFLVLFASGPLIMAWRFYAKPSPRQKELSGGAVVQRERIDASIKNASEMTYEEAAIAISEPSQDFDVAHLAGQSAGFAPPVVFRRIIADRRVSLMYETLLALPQNSASSKSAEVFVEKLRIHKDKYADWCSGTSQLTAFPSYTNHAASAALFLCATFCSKETFLDLLEKWDAEMSTPTYENGGASKHLKLPDPLLKLNLIAIALSKQGKSIDTINALLGSLSAKTGEPLPVAVKIKLYRWNAHTNETDFTHTTRGVPSDGRAILTEIVGFPDWPSSNFGYEPDLTHFVIDEAKNWLR